jgi:hypothetical protein
MSFDPTRRIHANDLGTSQQELIEEEMQILATLHPTYTRAQLREARDNLIHYYDFVWKIFLRMREDGRLAKILDNDSGKS